MTHIVRDVEKPGSKLHKKEVRAAAVHSLSLHAFSPRLALSAALLLLLLGKLCTTHARLLPLLLLLLPAAAAAAACLHTDLGAVKMTQTFKLNRTEHPVLTLFPRCPERSLLPLPPLLLLLLQHAPSPAASHLAWSCTPPITLPPPALLLPLPDLP